MLYQLSYAPDETREAQQDPAWKEASRLVGMDGLEPSTSRLSGGRSNQLSYTPFVKSAEEPSNLAAGPVPYSCLDGRLPRWQDFQCGLLRAGVGRQWLEALRAGVRG